MYDVFISYSRKDSVIADRIEKELYLRNISTFIDRKDIDLGTDFGEVIAKAISESTLLLFIWSENSNNSENATNEIALALDFQKIIVPIKIGEFVPHYSLAYRLGRKNRVDVQKFDDQIATDLCDKISKVLGRSIVNSSERMSSKVLENDGEFVDNYGAIYSKDKRKLLKGPESEAFYTVLDGTEIICDKAFYMNKTLINISLPATIKIIGDRTFNLCSNLQKLDIPNNIIKIGMYAFCGTKIKYICLNKNVEYIGVAAFNRIECSVFIDNDNKYYKELNGVIYNYDLTSIISCPMNIEVIDIPNSVIHISRSAVCQNKKLKLLIIPNSVKSIDDYALYGCSELEKIVFKGSLEHLGYEVFEKCPKLQEIYVPNDTAINLKSFEYFEDYSHLLKVIND